MDSLFQRLHYGKQYGYEVLFKSQCKHPLGKVGVIIAEMGLPEEYDLRFYSAFMAHAFNYILPSFIKPIVLADTGIGLIDPDNPLAREEFKPKQLIDSHGSFTNRDGKPYIECHVKWRPPIKKNRWDHGYFLYQGDGPSGHPDICDKNGAKVIGWYYRKLIPEKKVSWRSQMSKVYEDAVQELSKRFPEAEFRSVYYMDIETVRFAVEELLNIGCQSIVYQSFNCPVYSDFEDYGHSLVNLHKLVAGRARVIMADQIGIQPPMREAFLQILRDQLKNMESTSSVLIILAQHGHPFKKDTQDVRGPLYRQPLEIGVREIMSEWKGKWEVVWSMDEYADEYWCPKRTKFATYDAYLKAINEGYDYAIELPTEFPAENTDLMILHAMKKFSAFPEYDRNLPVYYPDWEKPLVRKFRAGRTTGIYAGTPVGPYRRFVVQALVNSITETLK